MWHLDHLAVACSHLPDGIAAVENRLGVSLQQGGQHLRYGTHNALLGLQDGLYLEVIAADPSQPKPAVRWFGLDSFAGAPRLANWICRCDDLAAALAQSPKGAGDVVDMVRGDLHWQIAIPGDGSLPMAGGWPTLMSWGAGTVHPSKRLDQKGIRLRQLLVQHPQADQLRTALMDRIADVAIRFETSATVALGAVFDTPLGERDLA